MHPLFSKEARFVMGVAALSQLPKSRHSEIAIIGRSNVGKSTLLNAITNRTHLARASATPGRTRELNYFEIGEKFHLVDMPGYGYAKAPKNEVDAWNFLIRDYLRGRQNLKRVLVLVDSRRGLLENDLEFMSMLDESAVSYALVLTKTDKINKTEREQVLAETKLKAKLHPACYPEIFLTSAELKEGIEELQNQLAEWIS